MKSVVFNGSVDNPYLFYINLRDTMTKIGMKTVYAKVDLSKKIFEESWQIPGKKTKLIYSYRQGSARFELEGSKAQVELAKGTFGVRSSISKDISRRLD